MTLEYAVGSNSEPGEWFIIWGAAAATGPGATVVKRAPDPQQGTHVIARDQCVVILDAAKGVAYLSFLPHYRTCAAMVNLLDACGM